MNVLMTRQFASMSPASRIYLVIPSPEPDLDSAGNHPTLSLSRQRARRFVLVKVKVAAFRERPPRHFPAMGLTWLLPRYAPDDYFSAYTLYVLPLPLTPRQ